MVNIKMDEIKTPSDCVRPTGLKINFVVYNTTSSLNTLISTINGYKDEYFLYLSNVRNPALAQIRSDVYFKLYTLKDAIYQGCLDEHGCVKTKAMKELREYCGLVY